MPLLTTAGDGLYLVGDGEEPGVDRIAPGLWEASGPVEDGAYWLVAAFAYTQSDTPGFDHRSDKDDPDDPAPILSVVIPEQAYAFDTFGYGTWTRVADVPRLKVRMPDATWRPIDPMWSGGPYPQNLTPHEAGNWWPGRSLGHHSLQVLLPSGQWRQAARYMAPGAGPETYGWFTLQQTAGANGGGYAALQPGWVTSINNVPSATAPDDIAWWGTLPTGSAVNTSDFSSDSQMSVRVDSGGFTSWSLRLAVYSINADHLRYLQCVYNPTGDRELRLRFFSNPVETLNPASGSGAVFAQAPGHNRLWKVTAPSTDVLIWPLGPGDLTDPAGDGYDRPAGRDIVRRLRATGLPSSYDELLHTGTGNPALGGAPADVYDYVVGDLTGVRTLQFVMEPVAPAIPPPPAAFTVTTTVNGSYGVTAVLV